MARKEEIPPKQYDSEGNLHIPYYYDPLTDENTLLPLDGAINNKEFGIALWNKVFDFLPSIGWKATVVDEKQPAV